MSFILEGIVTTRNEDGSPNIAAMGPVVELERAGEIKQLLFRPFQDSQTCRNLLARKQGVFHLSDDVLLFARAVTNQLSSEKIPLSPAEIVEADVISNACQWYEFNVTSCDTSSPRAELKTEIVHKAKARSFLGFNRAKHAVIETAILATRLHLMESDFLEEELKRFRTIVEKTAGEQERKAFALLTEFIAGENEVAS